MPAGRPSILTEDLLDKVREYIDSCEDENEQLVKQSGDNKSGGYETYENKLRVKLPTIEGLAHFLGIHKDTVYAWRKGESELHLEFSYLIDDLLAKQAERLVNNGLSGDYNPTIAKVLLTKHGYREGIDQTTDDKPITTLTPQQQAVLDKILNDK